MYDVRIPDKLYEQAIEAAQTHHVTVDQFILEAVQLHLQDSENPDEFFTPARVAEIREAQAEARTGNNISLEAYVAGAEKRRREWQANQRA
jgi:hypothetical protein